MVWCLFKDGAHLYFGEKQTKKFKLVKLCKKGLPIKYKIYLRNSLRFPIYNMNVVTGLVLS